MKPANCKCSKNKGRNLVVCIDGTSNQFSDQNTNVVELYSKIVKTADSGQLTYYNSGIGTYAKPSWRSFKYLGQVVSNMIDLGIAWNFEKIVMGAYRWLSENYEENDRIFLFGFSRGAYQVRALAGMIHRVGLIHKGNEEQIPFAYELYTTRSPKLKRHKTDSEAYTTDLADRFKLTFSLENVHVHFVGVWDTVSSVGIIRGKPFPLTDSADHVCYFRHALALDERRVKFLPEYVHGGVCEKSPAPERLGAQIHETGLSASPHIKEVWFPGTHSDIGGGNQFNRDLDLGRTPFLWMSFEAVSCGLRLCPTRVEWRWDHLQDMKESLTGIWHLFEWTPFKRLSYKDESSTTHRVHKGRGRKIRPGQKVHSSIAFCDDSYRPKASLSQKRCLSELVGKGSLSSREWVTGWEDLVEMDIFDLSLMSNVIEMLKLGTGRETNIWVYRLKAMTSTDEGLTALRGRPNIVNELVDIFTCNTQAVEVQECVTRILEESSKDHASILLSSEHRIWLLRLISEKNEINYRIFAVRYLAYSLSKERSLEEFFDINTLSTLDELARDEEHDWVPDGAFAMLASILNQRTVTQKVFAANTLKIVRKRIIADDSSSRNLAQRLCSVIMRTAENRRRLFDSDVLYYLLAKVNNWDATERVIFPLFLVNHYDYLPDDFFGILTGKLCDKPNDLSFSASRYNILLILRDTIHCDGLRKRMWNRRIIKALQQAATQVGMPIRSLALEIYKESVAYESLRDDLFDIYTFKNLGHALYDLDDNARTNTVKLFIVAMTQGYFGDTISDPESVATLRRALDNANYAARAGAIHIFTAAIAQESFRDKMFDNETIAALQRGIDDTNRDVRTGAIELLTAAMAHEGVRGKICNAETLAASRRALCVNNWGVRSSALKFLSVAVAEGLCDKILDDVTLSAILGAMEDSYSEDIRTGAIEIITAVQKNIGDKVFDADIITALQQALRNRHGDVRPRAVGLFTVAVAQEVVRDSLFDTETVNALRCALRDDSLGVRDGVVEIFIAAISQEGAWEKLVDIDTVVELRCALSSSNWWVRTGAVKIFTAAILIAQEGARDMIFNAETIAMLQHALCSRGEFVRNSAVDILSTAIAQGRCWDMILNTDTIAIIRGALGTLGDSQCSVRNDAVTILTAAIAQEGVWDMIFDTATVASLQRILEDVDERSSLRLDAIKFFIAAVAQEAFWDKIFHTGIITALRRVLEAREGFLIRKGVVEFFTAAKARERVADKIFDSETVATLRRAICHRDDEIRDCAISILTDAMSLADVRDRIFDDDTVAALQRALGDVNWFVRVDAIRILRAATLHEALWEKIFDNKTTAALQRALVDDNEHVRLNAIDIMAFAVPREILRDKIINNETIVALGNSLTDKIHSVRSRAIEFFTIVVIQDGMWDKICDIDTVTTPQNTQEGARENKTDSKIVAAVLHALGDKFGDVGDYAARFFTVAVSEESPWDKIFNTDTLTALRRAICDDDYRTRKRAVEIITAAVAQKGVRDKLFNAETVAALLNALDDSDHGDVRHGAIKILAAALGEEGVWEKIFNTEIVVRLWHALGDKHSDVRNSSSKLFTAVESQGCLLPKIYDHYITLALCEQLASPDLEDQTRYFVSEAIKYDDVHSRICTAELRIHLPCSRDHEFQRNESSFLS